MQMKLRPSSYQEVRRYKQLGAKERVSISDTQNTLWFMMELDGEPAGCCGLYLSKARARLKSVYTLPQYRGLGLGGLATDYRIQRAKELGYKEVETLTVNPQYYSKKGFVMQSKVRDGVWKMTREIA
jgi:N-acetylglutamate synthase-like GNAT family acetyltransferase